jgi:hypothetical protein
MDAMFRSAIDRSSHRIPNNSTSLKQMLAKGVDPR